MQIETTPIDGLLIIHPDVLSDERGFFFESYNADKLAPHGICTTWPQDNHALSRRNTLRGLHLQGGDGQAKLVRCAVGRIWDVAVDVRPGSPTRGRWFGTELSADNKRMFYMPRGFAHGYCVLSDTAEVLYKCSTVYRAEIETGFKWDDPDVAIDWPLQGEPILSRRDLNAQSYRDYIAAADASR